MKSPLIANEPNPYRREAILNVTDGIDVEYDKCWIPSQLSWLVTGTFVYNIDKALRRLRVNHKKDEHWTAPEFVDDEWLSDPEESAHLYWSIDRVLVDRLFKLKRIERRLVNPNKSKG